MTINEAFRTLVADLEEDEVSDPLAQRLTLGMVWADIARLAGEAAPPEVAALLDRPVIPARPTAHTSRRSVRA